MSLMRTHTVVRAIGVITHRLAKINFNQIFDLTPMSVFYFSLYFTDPAQYLIAAAIGSTTVDDLDDLYGLCGLYDLDDLHDLYDLYDL